jgi:hypothetical protein
VRKNKFELSDIVKKFGKELISRKALSPKQTKTLVNIVRCRTAELGGHEEVCDNCGVVKYSYNSCGDRHCPKCQSNKQALWIEKIQKETLPIKHFHVIFTVPHSLNAICLWNDKLYYKILFKSVWDTLRTFGYTKYGVETGAIAVLHTWGQNLSLHPHIHCIVPAAGYSLSGEWKNIAKNNFLYDVKQLRATFRGKFLDSLKRVLRKLGKLQGFNYQIQKAYETNWVVHCEPPMTDAKHVIKYLGQYTHRTAISNQRIIDILNDEVHFYAKDYRDNATVKRAKLKGVEFLRRFVQHILPKGFVRIRRYGIYNTTVKRNFNLEFGNELSVFEQALEASQKSDISEQNANHICPHCKKGKMIVIRIIPRIRSPAGHLPSILKSYCQ